MKHTLQRASVRSGGKLYMPGDQVDLPREYLISLGELDANGDTPAAPSEPEVNVQDILDANAALKADLESVTKERDELKASAGAVTLPADLEGKIAALKSVTKASAGEVMVVIRDALGIAAPTEPE
ncbi:hypothetical protein GCM10017784_34830 [Deinococcus indicus]|uniref:hypothetical protein n=1 Tax=Deinococcus indicus TaxID=223556 RepID=UPI00174A90F2|nr:hypothetical protein [Deinococcus indicus]GHG37493.1 hypothetical protein GCM10017784_34830 [Deinococcus indicus]